MHTRAELLLITGAAIGATAMFLLDPASGRRRRARLRDASAHAAHRTRDVAGATARDVRNRSHGLLAAARSLRGAGGHAPDDVLEARVRAKLGRYVSHASAVETSASNGTIELRGPILEAEASRALRAVARVRGVTGVVDRLDRHPTPDGVPALQPGEPATGERRALAQRTWSPATKLVAGGAGAALAAAVVTRVAGAR